MATTAYTNTSAKRHVYHHASTTTADTVSWGPSARSDMCVDACVSSTWLGSVPMEKLVRMLTPGGRKTCLDLQCAPRRRKKSWNTNEHLFGKNKSGRRNGKENGATNVGEVVDLDVAASAGVEGVSFLCTPTLFFLLSLATFAWHGVGELSKGSFIVFVSWHLLGSSLRYPIKYDQTTIKIKYW